MQKYTEAKSGCNLQWCN